MVPIHAFLIDHPDAGLILVDAGINRDMAHAHRQYYKRWAWRLLTEEDEYRLDRSQELATQVQRLGYCVDDIDTVVVTHMHEDHLGGLRTVSHAKVVLSLDAWDAKNLGIFSWRKWSPSFEMAASGGTVTTAELITFSSGRFHGFDRSRDLLGDGRIVLLPTPGHADGHLSVLVQMDDYELLLTGDVLYTLRHLDVDQVRQIMPGKRAQREQVGSIRRIQKLRETLPQMVILPTHDHTAYQSEFVGPFLNDGQLSVDERRQIEAYESQLFDRDWHLRPQALPHFVPPEYGGIGTVAEPRTS